MKEYDFIAIGGGSAGLGAARMVRKVGRTVAVLDQGPIGGLCALNGCNPKKVFVRSSEVLDEIRRASEFGIAVSDIRIDWSRVVDRKETFTSPVTRMSEESLQEQGIELIQGHPQFVGRNELQVNGQRLSAKGFLIATGSQPRRLRFEGAEFVRISDDLLALRQVPRRLFIVGAGVVGMEFGQVFARLGSVVTMITPDPRALLEHDEEIVSTVVDFSRKLGIEVLADTNVQSIRRNGETFRIEVDEGGKGRAFEADFILNAAGRPPSIDGLGLDKASVERDARGVVVNEFLRSPSNQQVFAAGDAHGRMQLSPVASYEGFIAARNFLEGDVERVGYDAIPSVVFTVPPLAAVGLTEAAARGKGFEVAVVTNDMASWKVFAIAGEPAGRSKVIVDSRSGRILGTYLFARGADEDIHVFAMAIRFGISVDQLSTMIYAYPTFASALAYSIPEVPGRQDVKKAS